MKARFDARISVLFALLFVVSRVPPSTAAVRPLATVNGDAVTGDELKATFKKLHGGHEKFLGGEKEVRSFLDIVIDDRLLVQEAYRLDLDKDPAVEKATAAFEDRQLRSAFVDTEIEDKSRPTEDQVREAWRKNTHEVLEVRQVVLDEKSEAEWALQELLGGADFDSLARTCSIAPSWQYGGRMPEIAWGMTDESWESVAFSLAPGEFGGPVRSSEGWAVLQVLDRGPVNSPDFQKVQLRIEAILKNRMRQHRLEEVSAMLWSKYGARIEMPDLGPEAIRSALQGNSDVTAASWKDGRITLRELVGSLDLPGYGRLTAGRFRDRFEDDLRSAVDSRLALLEARARGLDRKDPVAGNVRLFRTDQMLSALYAQHITRGIDISEAEIRAFYDSHKSEMREPGKRRISQIVVPTREKAEEAKRKIAEGHDFGELAQKISTDASSNSQHGDLGWITQKEIPPAFVSVWALPRGAVSEALPSEFGFHVFKMIDIRPERARTYDEAREQLREQLLVQKRQEKRRKWVRGLRAASQVRLNEKGIREFVEANSFAKNSGITKQK